MNRRRIAAILGTVVLAVVAALAVFVYRAETDPERYLESGPWLPWIAGPPPTALNDAADRHIEDGLAVLGDFSLPASQRIAQYREHLVAAEKLLERSLRAQPAQAGALSRLAVLRWELDPPVDPEGQRRIEDMIQVASEMAPRVPAVQLRLGRLLLRMGARDEGLRYVARAVTLSPPMSAQAIDVMREVFMTPEEMLDALPRHPLAVGFLFEPFREGGDLNHWVETAEPLLGEPHVTLIQSYWSACERLQQPERLRNRMTSLSFPNDPPLEAERLRGLSRALLELGEDDAAVEAALSAARLVPGQPGMEESYGDVLRRAGRGEEAIAAYRRTLGLLARERDDPPARARLYRKVGMAEDALGRPDRAYDAYKKALEVDPREEWAARRVREMREAAGVE
jgi:tetratricopeptide (TPR) repeat protein